MWPWERSGSPACSRQFLVPVRELEQPRHQLRVWVPTFLSSPERWPRRRHHCARILERARRPVPRKRPRDRRLGQTILRSMRATIHRRATDRSASARADLQRRLRSRRNSRQFLQRRLCCFALQSIKFTIGAAGANLFYLSGIVWSLSLADRLAPFALRLHPRRNRYACLRRAAVDVVRARRRHAYRGTLRSNKT